MNDRPAEKCGDRKMTGVPGQADPSDPKPLFLTSVRECVVVFIVSLSLLLGGAYESGPFALKMSQYLPHRVAHWLAALLFAIPMAFGSIFVILSLYLAEIPWLEKYLPVVWLRPGKPRFIGALFWLLIQILVIGVFGLLSSFET